MWKRKLLGLTCVISSLPTRTHKIAIYLFWRRVGQLRCFSPTWLRRAEAPKLWASSMTPHGSCPGGAPVTATWKLHMTKSAFIHQPVSIKRQIQAKDVKHSGKPADIQYIMPLTLFQSLLLHAGNFLFLLLFYYMEVSLLVFVFCVRKREQGPSSFLRHGVKY